MSVLHSTAYLSHNYNLKSELLDTEKWIWGKNFYSDSSGHLLYHTYLKIIFEILVQVKE